ncbi:MAG: hypothetical protein Q8L14_34700 [Myxococcales bacterium]|nr:hypothetical protein [Myxococcales bacterium]
MRRLVLCLLAGLGCVRAVPVPWALQSGSRPVDVCDGGTINAAEPEGGSGGAGSDVVLSPLDDRDAKLCLALMKVEPAFRYVDWDRFDFTYSFSTDGSGGVKSICAVSVPPAPEVATCLADKLRATRFPANERSTYVVHLFND